LDQRHQISERALCRPLQSLTRIVQHQLKNRVAFLREQRPEPRDYPLTNGINDPWLAELVRRADAGEALFDTVDFSQTPDTSQAPSSDGRVEALVEMICRAGDEPETKAAALLVLLATIEDSRHPKAVANTAKHLAFTRCGELNLFGMVEEQVATVERELFAGAV
jgi:hypothetical protein